MSALVGPLPSDACPECSGPLTAATHAQPALLWHGGADGDTVLDTRGCRRCGWAMLAAVRTERPMMRQGGVRAVRRRGTMPA